MWSEIDRQWNNNEKKGSVGVDHDQELITSEFTARGFHWRMTTKFPKVANQINVAAKYTQKLN
jgi:hypothetical protein